MSHFSAGWPLSLWLAANIVIQGSLVSAEARPDHPATPTAAQAGVPTEARLAMMSFDPREEFEPDVLRRKAEAGIPSAQYSLAQAYHFGDASQRDLAEARRWYERAAKQEHAWAQRVLGSMLAKGEGGPMDVDAAITWLRLSAEQGEPWAMAELGVLLRKSSPPTRDVAEARRWLRAAAERELPEAQFQLALLLQAGEGGPSDAQQAEMWLRRAAIRDDAARLHLQESKSGASLPAQREQARQRAEKGDAESAFRLGRMLMAGIGGPADEAAAIRWLRRAADDKHPGAMYHLSQVLAQQPDGTEAKTWLERAAEGGYAAAEAQWGRHQEFGSEEMIRWLKKAAEKGDPDAQDDLGSLPFQVTGGLSKAEGVTWLERSAAAGHSGAQYMLGSIMEKGWAGKRDRQAAVAWYRKAAALGSASAMEAIGSLCEDREAKIDGLNALEWFLKAASMGGLNLSERIAEMYAEGEGTPKNPALALKWYLKYVGHSPETYEWNTADDVRRLLAEHPDAPFDYEALVAFLSAAAGWGYPEAQYDLGMLYLEGRGVRRDTRKGAEWIEKAAKRGLPEAVQALARLLATGEGVPADDAQAVKLLQDSAERGDPRAKFALSQRYETGRGVPQDAGRALELLKSAAEAVPAAQLELGLRMVEARGMPKDVRRGIHLINEAAETLPEARRYLMDWLQGYPEPKRAEVPFEALLAEAMRGDPAAQLALAERYRAVPWRAVDVEAALKWVTMAAEQGHAPAQYVLAQWLANRLWLGNNQEKGPDLAKSLNWLKRAAESGHTPAQYDMAQRLLRGTGLPINSRQAISWLERAAKSGHGQASLTLGQLYGHGGYFPKLELPPFDRDTAQRWFLRAVELGMPMAYLDLARLYAHPAEGERDPVEAMKWRRRAREAGVRSADWEIAEAYLRGDGVPTDPERAIALLEGLAKTGDEYGSRVRALERLGAIFENGEGVPRDLPRAIAYYQQAAEFTNSEPAFHVAELYHAGPAEIRNPAEALRWYMLAIEYWTEGGDGTEAFDGPIGEPYGHLANARFALALRLERGEGLERDLPEALRWYQHAAYLDDKYPETAALAAFKAATLLDKGVGRAVIYADGRRREPDPPQVWYKKAAEIALESEPLRPLFAPDRGNEIVPVEDLDRRLPPIIEQVRNAAERGVPQAQFDFARFLLLGRGVPRNQASAVEWLEKAADQGHLGAACRLGLLLADDAKRAQKQLQAAAERAFARITAGTRFDAAVREAPAPPAYAHVARTLRTLIERAPSRKERPNITVFVLRSEHEEAQAAPTLEDLKKKAEREGYPQAWAEAAWKARPWMARAREAKDEKEAARWLEKAAEVGFPEAQLELARRYELGKGIAVDTPRAYTWYCLAAALGETDGLSGMDRLRDQLDERQIREAERAAAAWWQRHRRASSH